ncbi:histidinol phosphate phosphatase domain-containing protein [Oleidesulfovibrio alaskensis]|uniref:histidinol phosphate phosphatase domain-containing protein n=1 Tax=Oleidesulfovibrio alaskensis TaxID=58180 RepID=UPI001A5BBC89|nr:histidinol phosphate phosphatase domain-containing protein [Oleidesulfovibrio alaskensis]MBL3581699.1 histidinol phosphate phosphatase domain-containing protein [Oleidesulfovibrio alaskensis]
MIELRVCSSLSRGSMSPAQAARMGRLAGLRAMVLTEQVDSVTMTATLAQLVPAVRRLSLFGGIEVIAGCEIAHMPPALIPDAVQEARSLGARFVSVLGQYLGSYAEEGTNLAAIDAGCDLLAAPGLISEEEAAFAAERGTMLDITACGMQALANGHIAVAARAAGAPVAVTGGVCEPSQFINADLRRAVALGAGMTPQEYAETRSRTGALLSGLLRS